MISLRSTPKPTAADVLDFLESHAPTLQQLRRTLAFVLFMLSTLVLLVRPADLFPDFQGVILYQYLMICTVAVALPEIAEKLSIEGLAQRPLLACMLGIAGAVLASNLVRFNLYDARVSTLEFLKICAYFLLLIALVDTPRRMRQFLIGVVVSAVIVTVVALLAYHQWLPTSTSMAIMQAEIDPNTGLRYDIYRLRGIGIFNDPNDLCLLLAVASTISFYFSRRARTERLRLFCLALVGLFAYAALQTYSRGGFIGLLVGISILVAAPLGWRRGALLVGLAWLVIFLGFSARQTRIDLFDPENTFQTRLQLWSQSLALFRSSPFFGVGAGQHVARIGQVAHNSFIHSYAELGVIGGTLFLGAFALALFGVQRVPEAGPDAHSNRELMALKPCVLALLTAYIAGLLSLSRTYAVPTYLFLGIGAAFLEMARTRDLPTPAITAQTVRRVMGLGAAFVGVSYAFVRLLVRW